MDYVPNYTTFPDLSDISNLGSETLRSWEGEWATRELYRRYYSGEIFNETIIAADGSGEELEKYPVGLNLVKMLCLAQTDGLFGEWDEDIVRFEPSQDADINGDVERAVQLAQNILRASSANSVLWEIALDREIYGGGVLKISPDNQRKTVRWTRVQLPHFFPIWDPEDIDNLIEVYIIASIALSRRSSSRWLSTRRSTTRWKNCSPTWISSCGSTITNVPIPESTALAVPLSRRFRKRNTWLKKRCWIACS